MPLSADGYQAPKDGLDLTLTLDRNIQAMAETILREGIEENKGSSGNIIVLDPKTGAILAMANWPTYSPREYGLGREQGSICEHGDQLGLRAGLCVQTPNPRRRSGSSHDSAR